jgi:hypothetical protein
MIDFNKGSYGIDYQSYLLLRAGVKPVIRIGTEEIFRKKLEKICKINNLFIVIKKFNVIYNYKLETPVLNAYISTSENLAKDACEAESNGDRKELGKLLGYPNCCVTEFIKRSKIENLDHMIDCFLKTKDFNSFYCNFLFNFDSKLGTKAQITLKNNFEVFVKYEDIFLIKHVPCAFNCKTSMKIGETTLKLLKKELPQLAQKIEHVLKRPILYFDYFNWIVFNGNVNENKLLYTDVLPIKSLFPSDKIEIIKKGNKIEVSDDKIIVLKDETKLLEIQKENEFKGVLIDFI